MKIRSEGREGRPTAPRVASMLEIGKFGGCETSAAALVGWRDATAAPTTIPAARIAAGKFWFCHRDIVILKTRRGMARRHSDGATWRRCHDPGRAGGPCPAGRFVAFRSQSSRAHPPTDRSGEPSFGPTTPTLSVQVAGRRTTVPANASLNQRANRPRELGPNS